MENIALAVLNLKFCLSITRKKCPDSNTTNDLVRFLDVERITNVGRTAGHGLYRTEATLF